MAKIHVEMDYGGDNPQTAILEVDELPKLGPPFFQAIGVLETKHPDPKNRLAGPLQARSQQANFEWGCESLPSFKVVYFD